MAKAQLEIENEVEEKKQAFSRHILLCEKKRMEAEESEKKNETETSTINPFESPTHKSDISFLPSILTGSHILMIKVYIDWNSRNLTYHLYPFPFSVS